MTTITKGDNITLLFPYNNDVFSVSAEFTGKSMVSGDTTYYQFKKLNTDTPRNYILNLVQLKTFMGGDFEDCQSFEIDLD